MSKLQLSIAFVANPRTWPILDSRVKVEGIDLVPTVLHPSELFWRQLRFAEFDIAEMSLSSLLAARAKGDDRFVGMHFCLPAQLMKLVEMSPGLNTSDASFERAWALAEREGLGAIFILRYEGKLTVRSTSHWPQNAKKD